MEKFENINGKTLIGKNKMLFLINDSNNELEMHFNKSHAIKFDKEQFITTIQNKTTLCEKHNSEFYYCIIPDKSVICKDNLPFEIECCNRFEVDFITQVPHCYDLMENSMLNIDDYHKADSHINFDGAKKVVNTLMRKLFPQIDIDYDEISSNCFYHERGGDLMDFVNYGYETPHPSFFVEQSKTVQLKSHIIDNSKNIPFNLKFVFARQTVHHINTQPIINKKVLFYCDSSTNIFLSVYLSSIFEECLYYWDHCFFNEDVIEYFKPNIVIDIKTERFLNSNSCNNNAIKIVFYDKLCNMDDDREPTHDEVTFVANKFKKITNIVTDDEIKQNYAKCLFILK